MDRLFEAPLYPTLYLATLALHFLVLSLPLGAVVLLPLLELARGGAARTLRRVLDHYLPFSIGLTITAGVAPLLFLTVVHPRPFYNAGAILGLLRPALLVALAVAFLLTYVQKTKRFVEAPRPWRLAIRLVVLASFVAVGWIFTVSRHVGADADLWTARSVGLDDGGWLRSLAIRYTTVVLAAVIGCGIWLQGLLARWERCGRLSPGERFAADRAALWMILLPAVTLTVSFFLTVETPEWPWTRTVLIGGAALASVGLGLRAVRVPYTAPVAAVGFAVAVGGAVIIREAHRVQLLGDALDTTTLTYAGTRSGIGAFIVSAVICAAGSAVALRLAARAPETELPLLADGADD